MDIANNKEKGRAGLSLAIAWFGLNGYTVNIPLNDTQWYDLVVEKDGKLYTVQCKFTGAKERRINLRNAGGTDGHVYDNVLNHPVDYLFCSDCDLHMFLIPMEALRASGNVNSFMLNVEPYSNHKGFDVSNYLVQF